RGCTRGGLFLDELLHGAIDGIGDVDLTLGAHGDEVGFAELAPCPRRSWLAHGGQDLSIQVQPQQLAGESIDHIDVLAADIKRAGQTRILDLADVLSIRIENLDALILTVGHPELALGVHRDSVRNVELARLSALASPELEELAVLVELEDARILRHAAPPGPGSVALRNENVPVGSDRNVVGFVEEMRPRGLIPRARFAL